MGVLTTLFLVINSTALASAAGVPIVGASPSPFAWCFLGGSKMKMEYNGFTGSFDSKGAYLEYLEKDGIDLTSPCMLFFPSLRGSW